MTDDERWMRRALALAAARGADAEPNPAVGCVLVKDGQLLAEAATAPGGRPHAEEQALAATAAPMGATAYVTLEPCGARSSGAPSCAERLVTAGIARVVVGCRDPHPLASGRGLARLVAAGVPVTLGVLEDEAQALVNAWLTRHAGGGQRG